MAKTTRFLTFLKVSFKLPFKTTKKFHTIMKHPCQRIDTMDNENNLPVPPFRNLSSNDFIGEGGMGGFVALGFFLNNNRVAGFLA
ncbi:MAG: hypothetical protein A2056_00460 [Deltaproteobacteria bacterium GWA2_42_85]|nr:MAG: hypothetical protein A2056_00460 [Deltaproteobacteria bacterium GWA2_42_85]